MRTAMEWGEEKPIQYQVIYSSDTNELPEIEERLLRLEREIDLIHKTFFGHTDKVDRNYRDMATIFEYQR